MFVRKKKGVYLYTSERTPRRFVPELDWTSYLRHVRGERPSDKAGKLENGDLFDAVLGYVWSIQGITEPPPVLDKRQAENNRRMKVLISRAKTISAAGKRALLKDREFWYVALLNPSCGGEIEEIRAQTRRILEFYIRKYRGKRVNARDPLWHA